MVFVIPTLKVLKGQAPSHLEMLIAQYDPTRPLYFPFAVLLMAPKHQHSRGILAKCLTSFNYPHLTYFRASRSCFSKLQHICAKS